MPKIVRLLGIYSTFRYKKTDKIPIKFYYGAKSCISNYDECYTNLEYSLNFDSKLEFTTPEEDMISQGEIIYKYLNNTKYDDHDLRKK